MRSGTASHVRNIEVRGGGGAAATTAVSWSPGRCVGAATRPVPTPAASRSADPNSPAVAKRSSGSGGSFGCDRRRLKDLVRLVRWHRTNDGLTEPEIADADRPVRALEDVLRLQVQMQDAGLVRGGDRVERAAHEAGTLLHGDVPIASDHGPGAVALDVLSDDERDAVVLPSVEEPGQAPMRRQGHHPELQVESFGERGLAGELRADQLHDHAAVKDRVGGAPGGARPARAQLHLKGVPAGEHGGWLLIGPHPLSLRPCLRQNGREASDRRGPQTVEGPEVSLAFALTRESREAIRPAIRVEALFTTTTVALPVRGSMEKPSLAGIRDPGASCFTDSTAAL